MAQCMDPRDIYEIRSNQVCFTGYQLKSTIRKYQEHAFKRPIAERARQQFLDLYNLLMSSRRPIILDSGCGRGKSSQMLAQCYPQHWIIAVDQSADRLTHLRNESADNVIIVQENCIDLWRLMVDHQLSIDMHLLLYPNPWPKKQQEKRRWYAHPIAPLLFNMSRITVMRSNWLNYLSASATVAEQLGLYSRISQLSDTQNAMTHFEAKYHQHQVPTYQLQVFNIF